MTNFYITNDYKLRKIYGYKTFGSFNSPIRGMYATNLGGTEYLLVAVAGKLYCYTKEQLDNDYLLTPKKTKVFTGDGTTETFNLALTNIESVDTVKIEDEETSSYSSNLTSGTVTFTSAPEDGAHIEIDFTKHLTPTLLGNIPDVETSFFTFDKKVYILCGKYMSWDGTTLKEVEGYTPCVFINSPPSGGGLVYEELNMLSSKKHQTFNGDGTSTVYHLAQNYDVCGVALTSVDKVIVGTTTLTPTTDYTVDLTNGTVTFTTAPAQGMDNVDIYWTLVDGDRPIIEGMKFGTVFGGDLDTRVFLYGNPTCQNRTFYSGIIAEDVTDGTPSVEYFPASNFVDIGPSNFALTDLTRQYDRLLATTNRPEAYYLTIGLEKLDVTLIDNSTTTRYVSAVSTFPLNEVHGNFAAGQGQLIDNNPVTFDKNALIMWKSTNVRDERNMEDISQKIRLDLVDMNASSIYSLDHQSENQLWFGASNKIYIYNYYNKTFSRLIIPVLLRHFADLGNTIYMGTSDGKIVKWGEQFDGFDDEIIDAYWEMNFEDFDTAYLRKTMNRLWVVMQPQAKSSADVSFISNRASSTTPKHIAYNIQVMDNVDFSGYTFEISNNPQPFRLKMKAKKFTNLKIVIENTEKTDCTILQLVLKVESFGESK